MIMIKNLDLGIGKGFTLLFSQCIVGGGGGKGCNDCSPHHSSDIAAELWLKTQKRSLLEMRMTASELGTLLSVAG